MNLPWALLRIYSRTTLPAFVLLFTTTLMVLQVTQAQDEINKDDDSEKYYTGDYTIFPRPTTEINLIPDKRVVGTLSSSSPLPVSINSCVCVKFWQCPNNTVITDGTELIDIRFNINNTCDSIHDKCCVLPEDPEQPTTPPPAIVIRPTKEERQPCGIWNIRGVGFRITGNTDNETEPGEFPWMVVILNLHPTNKSRTELLCGGSLIHPKVVLTAAHCLHSNLKLEDLTVRAGEWDLKEDVEMNPHQDRKVLRFVKHERFSKGSGANDIALIFLVDPFVLQLHINTVCLPPQGFKFQEVNEQNCKASGWGSNGEGVNQDMLKKIDVPIVRSDECENKFRKSYLGPTFKLHNSFICAGGMNDKDTCRGDGGGPLVCPLPGNSSRFHQAGIVSWGVGCGNGYPGLYADVSQFRDWIDQQMSGLDQSFYDGNHVV